jgi:putative ABC transport system permease protein
MGIPLLSGRFFTDADNPDAPGIVIVNETMAKRYWPNESPTGRRIRRGGLDSKSAWLTVVGVVGDVRSSALDETPHPEIYIPHEQVPWSEMTLVVRAADKPLAFVSSIRAQILAVDSGALLRDVRPLDEWLARSIAAPRFNMRLLMLFTAVALAVASVGIYSVMNYAVTRRVHEFAVRLALGAQRGDLLRLVLGQGMALVMAGVALGLVGSAILTRLMKSLLFEVSPTDPITYAAITLLLTGIALVACWLPARRATRINPLTALRLD